MRNQRCAHRLVLLALLVSLLSPVLAESAVAQAAALPQPVQANPADQPLFVILRRSALKPPAGQSGDVLVAADLNQDDLARRTAALLSDPQSYPYFVLRLRRLAQNYLVRQGHLATVEPTYLFISDREGGFPAQSFWLETAAGDLEEKQNAAFVDMVFDEQDLTGDTWGSFAEIFAHELGHITLRDLAGEPSQKASNAVHFITVQTDPWYAFNEGWGEHFQPAALDHAASPALQGQRSAPWPSAQSGWYARFAREQTQGCFFCPANLTLLFWQGRAEQQFRDGAVRANQFARQVSLPSSLSDDSRPYYDAMLYRDILPPAPDAPLKNGAQMLASEGVLSALFYRMVSDPRLQNAWQPAEFYEQFAPGAPVTPEENVYLKLFAVFADDLHWDITIDSTVATASGAAASSAASSGSATSPITKSSPASATSSSPASSPTAADPAASAVTSSAITSASVATPPAIQIISGYTKRYPAEAEAIYSIFLQVTHGLTVTPASADLAQLNNDLRSGAAHLDSHLGPPLWLLNRDFNGGFGIFRYFILHPPYTFDLNAASAADLRSVPGIDAALAQRILDARESHGHFHSLDELTQVQGITPALLKRFKAMQQAMAQQLTETVEDNPAMVSLMLWLLMGSYAVAAVLQIGGLLLAGALIYMLVYALQSIVLPKRVTPGGLVEPGRLNPVDIAPTTGLQVRPNQTVVSPRKRRLALPRTFKQGLGVALLAFFISLGLYFSLPSLVGVPPFLPWLMAAAGLIAQGWRFFLVREKQPWLWELAAWVAVFALTGALY